MNKIAICLNGNDKFNLDREDYNYIIAVDGGYNYLLENNIVPDLIVGDLDSINNIDKDIDTLVFEPVKDYTDFNLALKFVKENFASYEIDVYNYKSINRIEHFYANLIQIKDNITFISNDTIIKMLIAGRHEIKPSKKYISFFAAPFATNVTTNGFKYNVDNYNLLFSDALMISNEIIDMPAYVEFEQGNLFVFMSDDDASNS